MFLQRTRFCFKIIWYIILLIGERHRDRNTTKGRNIMFNSIYCRNYLFHDLRSELKPLKIYYRVNFEYFNPQTSCFCSVLIFSLNHLYLYALGKNLCQQSRYFSKQRGKKKETLMNFIIAPKMFCRTCGTIFIFIYD